jgi:hypothetical protein
VTVDDFEKAMIFSRDALGLAVKRNAIHRMGTV